MSVGHPSARQLPLRVPRKATAGAAIAKQSHAPDRPPLARRVALYGPAECRAAARKAPSCTLYRGGEGQRFTDPRLDRLPNLDLAYLGEASRARVPIYVRSGAQSSDVLVAPPLHPLGISLTPRTGIGCALKGRKITQLLRLHWLNQILH